MACNHFTSSPANPKVKYAEFGGRPLHFSSQVAFTMGEFQHTTFDLRSRETIWPIWPDSSISIAHSPNRCPPSKLADIPSRCDVFCPWGPTMSSLSHHALPSVQSAVWPLPVLPSLCEVHPLSPLPSPPPPPPSPPPSRRNPAVQRVLNSPFNTLRRFEHRVLRRPSPRHDALHDSANEPNRLERNSGSHHSHPSQTAMIGLDSGGQRLRDSLRTSSPGIRVSNLPARCAKSTGLRMTDHDSRLSFPRATMRFRKNQAKEI
jgi:hypothetical protein